LLAHFADEERDRADQRGSARRALRLDISGEAPSAGDVAVTIRDLSMTGVLIETLAPLNEGASFQIELPEAGTVEATVVWTSGDLFGCRFNRPISPAALSAALLKGDATPVEANSGLEPTDILTELRAITAHVQRITAKVERSVEKLEKDRDGQTER
jgi:hypothetical protein